jgi:hypothetical protein
MVINCDSQLFYTSGDREACTKKQESLDLALEKVLGGDFGEVEDVTKKRVDNSDDDEERPNMSSKKGI